MAAVPGRSSQSLIAALLHHARYGTPLRTMRALVTLT